MNSIAQLKEVVETTAAEWMAPFRIRERREKADVAFLPLGALEWHGVHNPIGTDGIRSFHLCCLAAGKLGGGAVFPPLYWGLPRDSFNVSTGLEQTIEHSAAAFGTDAERVRGFCSHGGLDHQDQWLFYQRLLRMSLEQIAGFGFRSIYVYAGHGPLPNWIMPVAIAFSRASKMAGQPVTVDWGSDRITAGVTGKHGGKGETSVVMAIKKEAVDLDALENNPEYVGVGSDENARQASVEYGAKLVEAITDAMVDEVRWLVDHYPELPERRAFRRQG